MYGSLTDGGPIPPFYSGTTVSKEIRRMELASIGGNTPTEFVSEMDTDPQLFRHLPEGTERLMNGKARSPDTVVNEISD
jgi:hypothetical protein